MNLERLFLPWVAGKTTSQLHGLAAKGSVFAAVCCALVSLISLALMHGFLHRVIGVLFAALAVLDAVLAAAQFRLARRSRDREALVPAPGETHARD